MQPDGELLWHFIGGNKLSGAHKTGCTTWELDWIEVIKI